MPFEFPWSVHRKAQYDLQSREAALDIGATGGTLTVRIIDLTSGVVSNPQQPLDMQIVQPAADMQIATLEDAGFTIDELKHAALEFNDATWKVQSHARKPSPDGLSAGQVRMFLSLVT